MGKVQQFEQILCSDFILFIYFLVSQLRTDKDKKIIKVFRLQHFHQNESVGDERRVSQTSFTH